uniref:Glycosyl transferase family 25 domain-containing protein n=1 Tax=viral metagenome TaxID=1070528 RepID=A0A6C0KNR8_9ZZZZ
MDSTPTFQQSMELLTNTSNFGIYMIHLPRAVERVPFIESLERDLRTPLPIFEAADGYKLVEQGHPTTCQQRGPPFTRGAGCIGCTVSHINICKDALSKNYEYAIIFEDDCEFKSDVTSLYSEINTFRNLGLSWDVFLLGWDPQVSCIVPNTPYSKVSFFHETHACVISKRFMNLLIETYNEYIRNHTTLSIDTMYSNVIQKHDLNAYGCTDNRRFFAQRSGIYSYVVECVR